MVNEGVRTSMLTILVIIISFILIQIIRKIIGGSWDTEMVILTIASINAGATLVVALELGKTRAEFHKSLAELGSSVRRDITELKIEANSIKKDVSYIKADLREVKNGIKDTATRVGRMEIGLNRKNRKL